MATRRIMTAGLGAAATTLLTSCGTIIYPERNNQRTHGDIDPLILGMDAVGLLFFIIPGIIAFVVDFSTGAIYFPAGHNRGDHEHTIFEERNVQMDLRQRDIERVVGKQTGVEIDLNRDDVRVMRIERLDEASTAYAQLAGSSMLAAN